MEGYWLRIIIWHVLRITWRCKRHRMSLCNIKGLSKHNTESLLHQYLKVWAVSRYRIQWRRVCFTDIDMRKRITEKSTLTHWHWLPTDGRTSRDSSAVIRTVAKDVVDHAHHVDCGFIQRWHIYHRGLVFQAANTCYASDRLQQSQIQRDSEIWPLWVARCYRFLDWNAGMCMIPFRPRPRPDRDRDVASPRRDRDRDRDVLAFSTAKYG